MEQGMERGLIWLPLLGVFIGIAWAGWYEYQKVEAYQRWACRFQRAKYDLYAVLGQNGAMLTVGKPSRQGPIVTQQFSLEQVRSIVLLVDRQEVDPLAPPSRGRVILLEFQLEDATTRIQVPFSEVNLALRWWQALEKDRQSISQSPLPSTEA